MPFTAAVQGVAVQVCAVIAGQNKIKIIQIKEQFKKRQKPDGVLQTNYSCIISKADFLKTVFPRVPFLVHPLTGLFPIPGTF